MELVAKKPKSSLSGSVGEAVGGSPEERVRSHLENVFSETVAPPQALQNVWISEVAESCCGLAAHRSIRVIGGPRHSSHACGAVGVTVIRGAASLNCKKGIYNIEPVRLVYICEGVRQYRNCRTTDSTKSVYGAQADDGFLIIPHQGFEFGNCRSRIRIENRESQARSFRRPQRLAFDQGFSKNYFFAFSRIHIPSGEVEQCLSPRRQLVANPLQKKRQGVGTHRANGHIGLARASSVRFGPAMKRQPFREAFSLVARAWIAWAVITQGAVITQHEAEQTDHCQREEQNDKGDGFPLQPHTQIIGGPP